MQILGDLIRIKSKFIQSSHLIDESEIRFTLLIILLDR